MKKFKQITSKIVPINIKNVDTDMIIPANYLTSVSREGFGEDAFKRLREADPNFPLNLEKYQGAQILVADDNFGCGSSREHAVWALCGIGMRIIISKSFADIFYGNSAKNGLLLVTLSGDIVDQLLKDAESGNYQLTVSLEDRIIALPSGEQLKFEYDPFRKYCLLNGQDDIDYILSHKKQIDSFRNDQETSRFFSSTEPNR